MQEAQMIRDSVKVGHYASVESVRLCQDIAKAIYKNAALIVVGYISSSVHNFLFFAGACDRITYFIREPLRYYSDILVYNDTVMVHMLDKLVPVLRNR